MASIDPFKDSPYQVFFARTPTERPKPQQKAILLSFASHDWNDFSHRTIFHYRVFDGSSHLKPTFHGNTHLGFWDRDKSPDDIVDGILKHGGREPVPAGEKIYTMHGSLQQYRDIVENLDIEHANQVLLALNDLVAVQRLPKRPAWFEQATISKVFTLSFVRNAEAFFAFHHAHSILDGVEREEVGQISQKLTLQFQLDTFENEHRIDFHFGPNDLIPHRMAVLIGKNGTGKSQALFNIVSSLLKNDARLRDGDERPRINRLIAVSSPGETSATFPARQKNAQIYYRRILLQRPRASTKQIGLGNILLLLARSSDSLAGKGRWELFIDAISAIAPPESLFVRTRQIVEGHPAPVVLTSLIRGGEQERLSLWRDIHESADLCRYVNGRILPLSSGEVTFVRFAAHACLHIENGTLIVFDEPEIHLHPNLISKFVALLNRLLEISGSVSIIATHSAYFVREMPRAQVHVFQEDGERIIHIGPPRLRTLGADIGAISEFVFRDDLFGRLVADLHQRLAHDGADAADKLEKLKPDLPPETYMFLRRELGLDLL